MRRKRACTSLLDGHASRLGERAVRVAAVERHLAHDGRREPCRSLEARVLGRELDLREHERQTQEAIDLPGERSGGHPVTLLADATASGARPLLRELLLGEL